MAHLVITIVPTWPFLIEHIVKKKEHDATDRTNKRMAIIVILFRANQCLQLKLSSRSSKVSIIARIFRQITWPPRSKSARRFNGPSRICEKRHEKRKQSQRLPPGMLEYFWDSRQSPNVESEFRVTKGAIGARKLDTIRGARFRRSTVQDILVT